MIQLADEDVYYIAERVIEAMRSISEHKLYKPFMSKNQASKQLGRVRCERLMREGKLRYETDMNKRNSPIRINRKDVVKYIKEI